MVRCWVLPFGWAEEIDFQSLRYLHIYYRLPLFVAAYNARFLENRPKPDKLYFFVAPLQFLEQLVFLGPLVNVIQEKTKRLQRAIGIKDHLENGNYRD